MFNVIPFFKYCIYNKFPYFFEGKLYIYNIYAYICIVYTYTISPTKIRIFTKMERRVISDNNYKLFIFYFLTSPYLLNFKKKEFFF